MAKASKVVVDRYSDSEVIATWSWSAQHTDHYELHWRWATERDDELGTWQVTEATSKLKNSIFSIPEGATRVSVIVRPISTTYKQGNTDVNWWVASWSSDWWNGEPKAVFYPKEAPPFPQVPSTPSVTIDDYLLTAEVTGAEDLHADMIEFQINEIRGQDFSARTIPYSSQFANIAAGHASIKLKIEIGKQYVVRARSCSTNRDRYSDWSEWSDYQSTIPASPSGFIVCRASSETSVILEWNQSTDAKSYDIEYSEQIEDFKGSDRVQSIGGIEGTYYEKTGLETGKRYYFRIRAVNGAGESGWSKISSVVLGTTPEAPTTWSSTTTAVIGERVILYWIHNCEDGSNQTAAQIELTTNSSVELIPITTASDDDDLKINQYELDLSRYTEGANVSWRVRTTGVTSKWGEWSIQRSIDIYAPATLALAIIDGSGQSIDLLSTFPFYISAIGGPNSQNPLGYHVSIVSESDYDTFDEFGNRTLVLKNTEVYSKNFDVNKELMLEMSAENLSLTNNGRYTIRVTVTMDTGLTATSERQLTVSWEDELVEINARIGINQEDLSAHIQPYIDVIGSQTLLDSDESEILDSYGDPIIGEYPLPAMWFSVYRREYDGRFTEIMTGIDSNNESFVKDPHPALDFARYRIVGKTKNTGKILYYDVPGVAIEETSIVIQWDDPGLNFDLTAESRLGTEVRSSGTMLKLPWNIDISPSQNHDRELVEYIGRENPVEYYGTQRGEGGTWKGVIEKSDKERLYTIRRLASWMGRAYVREPSGTGYWAVVNVSYSYDHLELTVPVTLNITRVEGGA